MKALPSLMVGALLLAASTAGASEGRWLITPDEAASAGDFAASPLDPAAAGEGGPAIVVEHPKLLERLHPPVNIRVYFRPGESGLAPDMSSLTVTLRGFITIDLTDRLREYLRGNELAVEEADLPTGRHRIRLAISDIGGNLSARDMMLTVVEREQ